MSRVLKPLFKDKEQAMIKTIFDEKYDAGVAVGIEKERNNWTTDKVETLLRILTKRLGEVPSTVQNKLRSIHDLDVLGQLTDFALDCQSLDEFEEALPN